MNGKSKAAKVDEKPMHSGKAKARIIAAAERLFAEFGYHTVPVRKIAVEAGVPLASIHYHFRSKEGLYRAIFTERVTTMVEQRIAGLEMARAEPDLDLRIEMILKALVVPIIGMRNRKEYADFSRMLAFAVIDPHESSKKIVSDFFDPLAELAIGAISEALPDHSLEEVHWAYHLIIGSLLYVIGDNGRIARLSGGRCDSRRTDDTITQLLPLLTAAVKNRKE